MTRQFHHKTASQFTHLTNFDFNPKNRQIGPVVESSYVFPNLLWVLETSVFETGKNTCLLKCLQQKWQTWDVSLYKEMKRNEPIYMYK